VLVGAVNSSATFQFALAVKQSGLGRLVGQPTGGNRRGINGGAFFFVRLPRTGLEVDLPLVAGFPATPQPDEGVTPDVLVTPNVADIASGRDAELATVRAWIARSRSSTRRRRAARGGSS
jgi:C-terminal processing protease CtpA/Prc